MSNNMNEAIPSSPEEAVSRAYFQMHIRENARIARAFRAEFPLECGAVERKQHYVPYYDVDLQKMHWITFDCLCADCLNCIVPRRHSQSTADSMVHWLHHCFQNLNGLARHLLEEPHELAFAQRLQWIHHTRTQLRQGLHIPRLPVREDCALCQAVHDAHTIPGETP